MQPNNGIKTWQWVVTVIVIIVLIVIGVLVFGGKKSEAPTGDQSGTPAGAMPGAANRIVMSDQYPGNVVYLSSVQTQNAGWVAIHKDNAGEPGVIIGSAAVPAGINPVKVTLSESLVDGGTYYAMLHSSDGDGSFDAARDTPLKDSNGDIIMKVFHASASAGANLKG